MGAEPRGAEVDGRGVADDGADLGQQPAAPWRPSRPSASSTLSTPKPDDSGCGRADGTARQPKPPGTPGRARWPPGRRRRPGRLRPGGRGRPTGRLTSVHARPAVKKKLTMAGSGADQQRGQTRDEHGPPTDEGLLVVLAVGAEGPRRRADDQPDQRQGQGPDLAGRSSDSGAAHPRAAGRVRGSCPPRRRPVGRRSDGGVAVGQRAPTARRASGGAGRTAGGRRAGRRASRQRRERRTYFQYFSCIFVVPLTSPGGSPRLVHRPAMLRQ